MAFKRHVNKKGPQCQYYKRYGHIQKNCFNRIKEEKVDLRLGKARPKANKVGLITRHVLGVQENTHNWIVDSGATSTPRNSLRSFVPCQGLKVLP